MLAVSDYSWQEQDYYYLPTTFLPSIQHKTTLACCSLAYTYKAPKAASSLVLQLHSNKYCACDKCGCTNKHKNHKAILGPAVCVLCACPAGKKKALNLPHYPQEDGLERKRLLESSWQEAVSNLLVNYALCIW